MNFLSLVKTTKTMATLGQFRRGDHLSPLFTDTRGNIPHVSIRGAIVQLGNDALASGANSIAIGEDSTASGASAIAIGETSTAAGTSCVTIGADSSGGGNYTTVVGQNSSGGGDYSVVVGVDSETYGAYNVVVGSAATIGVAGGLGESNSVAIGYQAQATTSFATSLGCLAQTSQEGAIAIGYNTINTVESTANIGYNGAVWLRSGLRATITGGNVNNRASFVANADTAPTLNTALPFGPNIILQGVPTVGRNYTFDTGTNYDTAFPAMITGDSFIFCIANLAGGAFTITLTAAAGVTIVGTATVAQNICRVFQLAKTAASTYVATNLYSYTIAA